MVIEKNLSLLESQLTGYWKESQLTGYCICIIAGCWLLGESMLIIKWKNSKQNIHFSLTPLTLYVGNCWSHCWSLFYSCLLWTELQCDKRYTIAKWIPLALGIPGWTSLGVQSDSLSTHTTFLWFFIHSYYILEDPLKRGML